MRRKYALAGMLFICAVILLSTIILPISIANAEDTDAVLIMHFDEGSGTVAKDSSGNGNDGTIYGAAWTTGVSGKALSFDGRDDYVDCGNDPSLNFADEITIEAWIKGSINQPGFTWSRIVDKYLHNSKKGYILLLGLTKEVIRFDFGGVDGSWHGIGGTTPLNDNAWHHVVGTYDRKSLKVYVDGTKENEVSMNVNIRASDKVLTVGNGFDENGWHPFNGAIDEIRIYNRALTESEIKALYDGQEGGCGKITNWKTACTNVQLGGKFGAEMDFDNLMAGGYRFKGIVRVRSPTDEVYSGENQPRFVPSSPNNHGKFAGGNTLYVTIPEGASAGNYDMKLELWNADTNTLCDDTGWKENIFTVKDGGAVSEIVFIGTAIEGHEASGMPGEASYWIVSVDKLISGPQPCSNQIKVITGQAIGPLPWGYVDPSITESDKVKVYGKYDENLYGSDECAVWLYESDDYYIKKSSSSGSIKITSVSPQPSTTLNAGDTVTFTVNVDYDLEESDYGKIRLSVNQYTTGTTDKEYSIGTFSPHSGSYTFTHTEIIGDDWENVYVSVKLYAAKQGKPLPTPYTDFDYKQYPVKGKGGGSLLHFDLDYKGTEPASGEGDGKDLHQLYAQVGQSFVMYTFYKEGNAGNQYITRAYPEWDKKSFILNSDNDESTSELAQEMGGHRYDVENYIIPSVPGEYKIKVVYSNSVNPPTWDNYNRLLGEFTVIVEGGGDCFETVPSDHWKGEYYNNKNLEGSPVMVRDDGTGYLNFDWDVSSPSTACGIGTDFFSVRWTRTLNFDSDTWRFTATTDDGMRVYVDGSLVIDRWFNQVATTYTADVDLTAGTHTIKVEYYEYDQTAVAKLSWEKGGGNEIKFTGTTTDYWVSGGQIHHWTVLVDNVISGPQPCEDQVDIMVYDFEFPPPWGYVDPNLNVGDRVEVYGRYYEGHCSAMHLHGSTDYYIKRIEPLDLYIASSDISFSKENPTWGDKIIISAIIHNTGNMDAKGVSVKFYYSLSEINPSNPGNIPGYIFHDEITDIPANQEKKIEAPWIVNKRETEKNPKVFIHVTVDLPSEIKETEDFKNNYATYETKPKWFQEPHLKGATRIILIPVYVDGKGEPGDAALKKQYEDINKARALLKYYAYTEYGMTKEDVTFEYFAVVDKTSNTFTTDTKEAKISSISERPHPKDYHWVDEAARNIGFNSAAEIWYLATQQYEDKGEKIVLEFALNEEFVLSNNLFGLSSTGTRVYATFKGEDYKYLGICSYVDVHEFLHKFGADDEGWSGRWPWDNKHLCSIMNQDTLLVQCTNTLFCNPWLYTNTAKEIGWISEVTENELNIIAHCPVDLEIIDPEGLIIKKDSEELWGLCYYVEYDIDGDGSEDDIIEIFDRKIGDYKINIIPEPEAEPTDTYTLEVIAGDTTTVLAENVPVSEIPAEPYIFKSEMSQPPSNPTLTPDKSKPHPLGTASPLNITNNEVDDSDPTIVQISNGNILVAYTNWLNGAQIYLTRSSDNGLTWSTPVAITNQYHNIDPYITHTSDGKVWIVWTGSWVPGDFDNYYVTSDDNGQTWSEIKHIPNPEDWGTHTTIAEDSNHNVWIMWGDHYVISDDFGEHWSQINQMPSWNGNNPSLFCDANGRLWIVTWSGGDIRYKVSDDNGQTWSPYTVVVDELSQDEAIVIPEITQSVDGTIWITYHSNINGNREVYCTSSSDSGNTWSNPKQITDNPSQDWVPAIASINDVEIWVTWDSNRDGDRDIYLTKILIIC